MKKLVYVMLVVLLLLGFVGCGASQEPATNTNVVASKEESSVAESKVSSQEESKPTESKEESKPAESKAESKTATIKPQENKVESATTGNLQSQVASKEESKPQSKVEENPEKVITNRYLGSWKNETNGGVYLDVTLQGTQLKFVYTYVTADARRIGEISVTAPLSDFKDYSQKLAYSTDGWGNSGNLEITFKNNKVICTISNVTNPPSGTKWGIPEETVTLSK